MADTAWVFRVRVYMLDLTIVKRTDPRLLLVMEKHYSKPKGFVGRNICLAITFNGILYGFIVGGSATRHLPGRTDAIPLNRIINNIFFHIEKVEGRYPIRNFAELVLKAFELLIVETWQIKYGDKAEMLETLVELPRTGECYRRSGWTEIGVTKGYTCKRTAGKSTDSWTGKRVWDVINLRPKRVFIKRV